MHEIGRAMLKDGYGHQFVFECMHAASRYEGFRDLMELYYEEEDIYQKDLIAEEMLFLLIDINEKGEVDYIGFGIGKAEWVPMHGR